MRVLVTGGSGRLGQVVLRELVAHGHEAINADRRPPASREPDQPRYVETDLTDVGEVLGALRGCEALIHLGAIPAPYHHADEVVFGNNTTATFAALQSAALLGVQRVAIASSISAYGMAYARPSFAPLYVPLDEAHPLLVHDPYGLSKEVDERTAEMFHRQSGTTVAALRFHWVAKPEELTPDGAATHAKSSQNPTNLWGYVDVRDAASVCRLAIEQTDFGFEPFNITAADTLLSEPTVDAIRRELPTTEIRAPLAGNATAFSIDKAKRILGWEPHHSWRSANLASVPEKEIKS